MVSTIALLMEVGAIAAMEIAIRVVQKRESQCATSAR